MLRLLTALCAFALLASSCSSSATEETTAPSTSPSVVETTGGSVPASTVATTASSTTTAPAPATSTTVAGPQPALSVERRPKTLEPFAPFEAVPLLSGSTYSGPPTPTSMSDVLVPTAIWGLEPHHPALEERGRAGWQSGKGVSGCVRT